jgi:hypothetical protein
VLQASRPGPDLPRRACARRVRASPGAEGNRFAANERRRSQFLSARAGSHFPRRDVLVSGFSFEHSSFRSRTYRATVTGQLGAGQHSLKARKSALQAAHPSSTKPATATFGAADLRRVARRPRDVAASCQPHRHRNLRAAEHVLERGDRLRRGTVKHPGRVVGDQVQVQLLMGRWNCHLWRWDPNVVQARRPT